VVTADVLDIHEEGCGLDLKVDLPVGEMVTAAGDFGAMLRRPACDEARVTARVTWCQIRGKRVHLPMQPGMSLTELEELLGVPREHLEFNLWFLHEQGLAVRSETGRYSITPAGVLQAEQPGEGLIPIREDGLQPATL